MPEESEGNNHTRKINFFFPSRTRLFPTGKFELLLVWHRLVYIFFILKEALYVTGYF